MAYIKVPKTLNPNNGVLLPLASPLPFQCRGLSNKLASDSSCQKAVLAAVGIRQVQQLLKPFLIAGHTKEAKLSAIDSSIIECPENQQKLKNTTHNRLHRCLMKPWGKLSKSWLMCRSRTSKRTSKVHSCAAPIFWCFCIARVRTVWPVKHVMQSRVFSVS